MLFDRPSSASITDTFLQILEHEFNDEDKDVIMVFEHKYKPGKDTKSAPQNNCYRWIQDLESKDAIQVMLEDEESWGHIDELDELYDYGSTSSLSDSGVRIHQ